MYIFLAAVFIMPTILYIMNIIYLKENRKRLSEPDRKETITLLIFDGFMLFVGLAVVAFYVFLSFLAMGDPSVSYFELTTTIAIGVGIFLYLIGVNVFFIWQLVKLLRQT